jgi:hypothetical protein
MCSPLKLSKKFFFCSDADRRPNVSWINHGVWFIGSGAFLNGFAASASEQKKNFFESFKGEHIRMTEPELFSWMDKYFK